VIVASQFGWSAVAGPDAMSHYDLLLAAQLMSEERVGKPSRAAARSQAATEDAAMSRLLRIKG
jgi:hypothetical protein